MGRKGRYDREYKGSSSYTHSKWDDAPSRGRSRSRSDSPYRKRDVTPPKRLQDRIERSISRTPSPSRRRDEHSNGASLRTEGRTSSRLRSRSPSPARRRRDDSRSPVREHRRHERSVTPVRPRKRQRSHSRSPSRSPSPYRDDSRSTQWRHKKASKDTKRHRDRDRDSKSGHREHDVWKPSQSSRARSPSPRASRNRSPSRSASPHRSVSPSLRKDPPGTAGRTGRDYPTQHPSSLTVSGRGDSWRPAPTSPMHNRSQSPDKYTNHHRHSSSGYERPPSSTHSARQRSVEQPSTVRQLSEPRGNDQNKERPNRRRGMDYDRAEWDAWEAAQKEQEQIEKSREAEAKYQHQVPNDYPETNTTTPQVFEQHSAREERHPELEPPREPRRRTPEGPRALYQGKNRQHHHNRRKDNYRNNSNQRNNHSREGFPRLPSQPAEQPYPGLQQYPERIQQHPPQEPALPPPPPIQHELVTQSSEPLISSGTPASAPPAPKPNGGIKPFTLKANVLKNLKRTQESDPEAERVLKSSRISPQHVIATSSTAIMPPPVPAEIQQTQTPETPSNQDATQERKPPTREKGASLFERIGQVGEGTYGKVYKAKNTLTGELVALKKIRMEAEKDGFPITAMREIKLLESLRHPNVIHLHEMMFEKSFVYMVFQYMDHDLSGILTHPTFTLPPAHVKDLLRQMLEGLHYLHHRGILHRDIKGSNILLNASGQLKLADFGLARHYHKRRDNLNYTNRVITLWYRPPELLLGATTYGPAVDIWGIGCIMLEMVTKKAIFPGKEEIDEITRIWDIMGSPTSTTWPKVTELPWWELVKPQTARPSVFHELYADVLSEQGIDLASKLLSLDPELRPTAAEALRHPYFVTELPRPEQPTGLAELDGGEWHEFESKQRKRASRAQNETHNLVIL